MTRIFVLARNRYPASGALSRRVNTELAPNPCSLIPASMLLISRRPSLWLLAAALLAEPFAAPLAAQERAKVDGNDGASVLTSETYVRPSPDIERLVLAPRHLN